MFNYVIFNIILSLLDAHRYIETLVFKFAFANSDAGYIRSMLICPELCKQLFLVVQKVINIILSDNSLVVESRSCWFSVQNCHKFIVVKIGARPQTCHLPGMLVFHQRPEGIKRLVHIRGMGTLEMHRIG